LQYLEFVDRCLEDLHLSDVISRQNIKTFVIVSSSIIEALFFYLLRSEGRAAKTPWQSVIKIPGREFTSPKGVQSRADIEIFQKGKELYEEMTFNQMCQKVESKKLVKLSNEFYKKLPYLRNLRNRVHVHILKDHLDTDYLKISRKDLTISKSVLLLLLTSELFPDKNEDLFEFLNP
jgi:hypothetical protein